MNNEQLINEFTKLQESRIKGFKKFDDSLKYYLETGFENIYKQKIVEITKEFNEISKKIIDLIDGSKDNNDEKIISMMKRIQMLEKEHLTIEVELHSLICKRKREQNEYKKVCNSEEKKNKSLGGFHDANLDKNNEIIRGENLININDLIKKKKMDKNNNIEEILIYFTELKFFNVN